MPRMSVDKVKERIKEASDLRRPFVVRFQKRTTGEIRVMTCVTHDPSGGEFVTGLNDAEKRQRDDEAKGLVTVFALDVFQKLVSEGEKRVTAGHKSWRRIPLSQCRRVEVL